MSKKFSAKKMVECNIAKWPFLSPERFLHIVFPWREEGKIRRIIITNFWRWSSKWWMFGFISFCDV